MATRPSAACGPPAESRSDLAALYERVRRATVSLVEGLAPEDTVVQSMPDVSPTKWHLAHVTWFFETFVLTPAVSGYRPFHPGFSHLFNSYYETVGSMHPRPRRGLLSRPTLKEVLGYRRHVDLAMEDLLCSGAASDPSLSSRVRLGLEHEQQHQELLLMDVKHVFSCNPLRPAYSTGSGAPAGAAAPAAGWVAVPGGLHDIGHEGDGFSFDNERPRHAVHIVGCELADCLVTCGEHLEFMADGGYDRPELWLADGWTAVQSEGWRAPLYWSVAPGEATVFTLAGEREIRPHEPLVHVSYYEADAHARWAGARLPREAEWEVLAASVPVAGNFLESGGLQPEPAPTTEGARQLFGDAWEWTQSAYSPYPGFLPEQGAIGEYNGKFMANQFVLRGGACVTPRDHARLTYRNFYYPHQRWQFGGFRLAREAQDGA